MAQRMGESHDGNGIVSRGIRHILGLRGTGHAMGLLVLDAVDASGNLTTYYLWVDSTGRIHISTSIPTDEQASGNHLAVLGGSLGGLATVEVVNSGAASITVFDADCPNSVKIVDALAISTKAGNAGTWKLNDGTNDITTAVAYGTSDNEVSRVTSIDPDKASLAPDDTLKVINSDNTDTAVLYISFLVNY